jgi:hypothetical protein
MGAIRRSSAESSLKVGFTLAELSLVLVIIGLIIGGIVVGRDLIDAAAIRAQITQIEKFNSAVNTFRGKYGYLPGDIPDPYASQYGFTTRSTYAGMGDGNGIIQGQAACQDGSEVIGSGNTGEVVIFWSDLTYANGMNINLIDGSYYVNNVTNCPNPVSGFGNLGTSDPNVINTYFPQAKIGQGNYVYVWSGNSANYYGISAVSQLLNGRQFSSPALSVSQASRIDQKVDDGLPQSGNVTALYVNDLTIVWAGVDPGTAVSGSSTTCYDNADLATNTMRYSVGQSNGSGVNCALSFKFQ